MVLQITDGSIILSDMSLTNVGKAVSGVTFRLSLTPALTVPSNAAILISLAGSAPHALSSNAVVFSSPSSGASATVTVLDGLMRIQLAAGVFSVGQPISLSLPGTVTNAASVQPQLNNVSISIVDVSGCVLAFNSSVSFRSIIDGSLGSNMPKINLNDWSAGGVGVSMTISFTPSFDIPAQSSVLVTLSGSAPQSLSSNKVLFVFPSVGFPSASASLLPNGVLSLFLQSGNFTIGENITLKLPGTVTTVAEPKLARNDVSAAVIDSFGVVLCESVTGTMHAIVNGRLDVGIQLDWRGSNSSAVSLYADIVPFCDIPSGSSIIITLAGSAPVTLSSQLADCTTFSGLTSANARVSGGVLTVTGLTATLNSGQLMSIVLPGTITNAATAQPSLNNVSVSIVDSLNVLLCVNRSVFFHAIHDSGVEFSHSLSGYSASSVGVRTFGSFKLQGADLTNALVFSYPPGLFASSRYAGFLYLICAANTYILGPHVHFHLL
jgi:hypothetical protein